MAIEKRVVTFYKCEGCGHEWQSRRGKAPKICPVCKRASWNVKRPKK